MAQMHRRNVGDLEIGATDALRRHPTAHLAADHAPPIPPWILKLEAKRPRLLRECLAEAAGTFAYVYCGVSGLASFTLTTAAGEAGFGSILNVAFGFAFGIAFALITSAATSGGHFNPAMTLVFATLQGFPWRKVPLYITSQVTGSFLASMVVYAQWYEQIHTYEAGLTALGETFVSTTGPAGIFCAIPGPTQSNGWLFVTEFFADVFIGFIIWATLDPNNPFVSPRSAPFIIGLAYYVMILGFGAATLSTNTARDLGARMMAACFYGSEVFTVNDGYAAISILVNIPATFCGVLFYQFVMGDATKLLESGHALPAELHKEVQRERQENGGQSGRLEDYLRKHPTIRDSHAAHEKENSLHLQ